PSIGNGYLGASTLVTNAWMSANVTACFLIWSPELNGLSRLIMSTRVERASRAPVQSRVFFFLMSHQAGGALAVVGGVSSSCVFRRFKSVSRRDRRNEIGETGSIVPRT